ncbi:rhomboid family intramembrane serine protease [Flavobacteriaceae bacterium]|nr:rhomboid family intramembrane serine protease [Flavobacteriaceae bacterium]
MGLIDRLKYNFINLDILQKIILIMIVFFVIPHLINTILFLFNLSEFSIISLFDVSPDLIDLLSKPWSLITYGFFHSDLRHLFVNMIILYLSGSVVLNLFGNERLIKIFILGLLYGSIVYLISYNLFPAFNNIKSSMIGSSAGVMAVFIFLTSYNPNYKFKVFDNLASGISSELFVLLKIIISIVLLKYIGLTLNSLFLILIIFEPKIVYLALVLILNDVIQIPYGNPGGHIAHLGGALSGYIMYKKIINGNDHGKWIISFYNFIFNRKTKSKKRNPRQQTTKSRADVIVQKKIDLILDKISKSGYDSLTKDEKETLFKAGKS